jgi:hypothetical protein
MKLDCVPSKSTAEFPRIRGLDDPPIAEVARQVAALFHLNKKGLQVLGRISNATHLTIEIERALTSHLLVAVMSSTLRSSPGSKLAAASLGITAYIVPSASCLLHHPLSPAIATPPTKKPKA